MQGRPPAMNIINIYTEQTRLCCFSLSSLSVM